MPLPSPRALDRRAEEHWPWLLRERNPWTPLYVALWMLAAVFVLMLAGPPYSYGAAGGLGAPAGLIIRVIRDLKRTDANRPPGQIT
ncbi:MAG: hypothetical protein QOK42_845 [Frankiaceae bacterium]|nr:hypothetical protein [Frankiaceae bacterium]